MAIHQDLSQRLERHRAFWDRSEVDGPLLRVTPYSTVEETESLPLAGGLEAEDGEGITIDKISVDRLPHDDCSDAVDGDFVRGVEPYDLCWAEAMAGCPLRWKTGHVWAEPFLDKPDPDAVRVVDDNPWLAALSAVVRRLVDRAAGRYPITQPSLRGPIDIASAVIGDEQVCMTAIEDPEPLAPFLGACTDVFLAAAERWQTLVPRFAGGTCVYGIWAPGTTVRIQCDNAALLSPRLYEDLLVPCDERICERFHFPLMHTHGSFIRIVADALIANPRLRAIQVSTDYPAGPSVADLLPTFQKINAQKPLILTGAVTQSELDLLLDTLDPRGLCLLVAVHA